MFMTFLRSYKLLEIELTRFAGAGRGDNQHIPQFPPVRGFAHPVDAPQMRSANKKRFLIQAVRDEGVEFMGTREPGMMERSCFSPQTGESAEQAIEIVQDEWVFHRYQVISKRSIR